MQSDQVNTAIELTPIIIAIIGGVFAIIRSISAYYIDKRVKDRDLAEILENAVQNALGVMQQAASGVAVRTATHLNVPQTLAPGVQYVIDHAPEAVERFGVTPTAIAEKLVSRAGMREIETNIAATRSSAAPVVVPPLAPSAPVTDAAVLNRQELDRLLAEQGSTK